MGVDGNPLFKTVDVDELDLIAQFFV